MTDHQHSAEYDEYMQSRRWFDLRKRILKTRGFQCEMCGANRALDSDLKLEVHHWEARRLSQAGMKWATLEEKEMLDAKIVSTRRE